MSTDQVIANELDRRVLSTSGLGGFVISYSQDGKKLFYFKAGKIVICDGETGDEIISIKYDKPHSDIIPSFSPDGKILADSEADKHSFSMFQKVKSIGIKLVDVDSGKVIGNFGNEQSINRILFSPSGKIIAVGYQGRGWNRLINLWDVESKQKIRTLELGRSDYPTIFSFSPNGKTLISVSFRGDELKLWDIEKKEDVKTIEGIYDVRAVCFSPDGRTLAVSGHEGIELFEVGTWKKIGILRSTEVQNISFSPDGEILAVLCSTNGSYSIVLWHIETKVIFGRMKNDSYLRSIRFSPTGNMLATAGTQVILWNPGYYLSIINGKLEARKGELETSEEYSRRMQRAKKEIEIKKEEARRFLASKLFPIRINAELGNYSADLKSFSFKSLGKKAQIKVPRDKAALLIESRDSRANFYVDAKIKMVNDGTFLLVDAYFVDPSSGMKIPLGG